MFGSKPTMVSPDAALPGRDAPVAEQRPHAVHGRPIVPPWPDGHELAVVGMGCFWGAERIYWSLPGVSTTFVGYAGGYTPNPTYREVCSGRTGHAEVAGIVFDPTVIDYEGLLGPFWENHDPTQHHRQGNDVGTQYRSCLLVTGDEQRRVATASRDAYQAKLTENGFGAIATDIADLGEVYWAEVEHQQYLHKHPGGYCNHGFCQVAYSG